MWSWCGHMFDHVQLLKQGSDVLASTHATCLSATDLVIVWSQCFIITISSFETRQQCFAAAYATCLTTVDYSVWPQCSMISCFEMRQWCSATAQACNLFWLQSMWSVVIVLISMFDDFQLRNEAVMFRYHIGNLFWLQSMLSVVIVLIAVFDDFQLWNEAVMFRYFDCGRCGHGVISVFDDFQLWNEAAMFWYRTGNLFARSMW